LNKTTKCQYCGEDVLLPFRCPYCNQYFCVEHRLPENHACPESWRARVPRPEAPPVIVEREPERVPYEVPIPYIPYRPRPKPRLYWFSPTELKHLALGTVLVMGVSISLIPQLMGLAALMMPKISVSLAIVFTFAFLLHELAHKLSAQHFGLWAEFRLTMFGALITLLSMLSPFFKIISPGAVMITGPMTKETVGKTSLAGPLTNIALSILCVTVVLSLPHTLFWLIAIFGAWINAIIALFNLIPFGVLDGAKVFWWNKMVWSVTFVVSVALAIFAFNGLQGALVYF